MTRIYRPLTDKQKRFVRRNYGEMTAPQLAERLSVEQKRVINYINHERKMGESWVRKSREQNHASRSLAGRKGNAIKYGYAWKEDG